MAIEIKNRYTGAVLKTVDAESLSGADLSDANLSDANLSDAELRGADLSGADLTDVLNASLSFARIQFLPETGSFEAWKKCRSNAGDVIVKLLIPATAKRSHGSERKSRASKVKVLKIFGATEAWSSYNCETFYRAGKVVTADSFDENRWDVCSHGIHFFLTRAEAEAYIL